MKGSGKLQLQGASLFPALHSQLLGDAFLKLKDKKLTLEKVQPRMIYKYVQDKQAAGQTCCSIRKHLVILNGVFKEAVQLGEISQNPCANVTVTNRNEEVFEGNAYDPETAKALLNAVKGDPIEPAVYLGLFLGLRRSEVVGLRWKDIDFDKKLITIQNTVVRFSTISELDKQKVEPAEELFSCLTH